ncbi:DUF1080 domain-containing protein [Candidatus Sumerlaeota bacterium]|nr:DUF1080 domain-containing protein [Candidatus Sumerlaeota bacterium]MBI3736601.1 DUF1080 domain-containing protein [Candidatus Sumerlaeota bacterium]
MRHSYPLFSVPLLLILSASRVLIASDNELTPGEKSAGWQLLFNGKDHSGWKTNEGKSPATPIEDGCLVPYKAGGYMLAHEKQFGDFILRCDVKMAKPYCNSGIFFRVGELEDPPRHGPECQIANISLNAYDSYGAIYDLAAPSHRMDPQKMWDWHTIEITCNGPNIQVAIDGEVVTKMNCDDFTEKGKRPGGAKHKFDVAVKDWPRKGYIGLQDHDTKVWFKNIKILELKP